MNISHVSLHVRLICALVRAEGTSELWISGIHLASKLHVPPQQVLQRKDLLAETAHVPLVTVQQGLCRSGNLKLIEFRRKLETIDGAVVSHVTLYVPNAWNKAKEHGWSRVREYASTTSLFSSDRANSYDAASKSRSTNKTLHEHPSIASQTLNEVSYTVIPACDVKLTLNGPRNNQNSAYVH